MPLVNQPLYSGNAFRSIIQLVRKPISHHPLAHVTALQLPNVTPHPAVAHIGKGVVHELSVRVARSLEACKNRGRFAKDDWRKRTRACIETTGSLVFGANASFAWFGDIEKLLGDIGVSERPRELSLAGTDQFFVMCWTCLSLLAIRKILERKRDVQLFADMAVKSLAGEHDTGDDRALTGAQKIDKIFHNATECLARLHGVLFKEENLTKAKEILRDHESKVLELENINTAADRLKWVDHWIFATQSSIARQITSQFPGVLDDTEPVLFSHFVKQFHHPRKRQLVRPGQILKNMCSFVPTLRNILEGQEDNDAYKELMKSLKEFHPRVSGWQGNEIQRQLWRLQDLRDGGGLGFMVELFFLAFSLLLSTSSSKESHSALYASTFRAITSDWSKQKPSLGTQKLLLDIALSRGTEFDSHYPAYIADEFLILLGDVFEGQTGLHIDETIQQLAPFRDYNPKIFRARAFKVISWARAQSL